eukprot:UN27234
MQKQLETLTNQLRKEREQRGGNLEFGFDKKGQLSTYIEENNQLKNDILNKTTEFDELTKLYAEKTSEMTNSTSNTVESEETVKLKENLEKLEDAFKKLQEEN